MENKNKGETILQEAERLTSRDRQADYGHPKEDFRRIAGMWGYCLNVHIEPEQVAMMMIMVKLSREMHKHKRDNMVDIAGYANTLMMCMEDN